MAPFDYQMKIAICDDDEGDRAPLLAMLSEYLDLHHYSIKTDIYVSGEDFLQADVTQYPLVILDILMGQLNGIETAKKLVEMNPDMQIIFYSSSNAYAAESYDVSALRYLTKPAEKEKLFATLDRFFHVHTSMRTLTYKKNRMDERVYISDILWVEANGHKSMIHTRKETITTGTSFSQICDQLKDADFVKPIRYALVSLQAVTAIPSDVFTLVDGSTVPISRDLRGEMKQRFTDYKMKTLLQKGGAL